MKRRTNKFDKKLASALRILIRMMKENEEIK